MADETTTSQAVQDTDVASNNEQALETSPDEGLDNGIPEKFVGKSPIEIIGAYRQLEKRLGQISSERASEKREREESDKRFKQLEQEIQTIRAQTSHPQQNDVMESEEDPLSEYEKEFDADPKQAIKKLNLKLAERAERKAQKIAYEADLRIAREYHSQQLKDNPEYQKLTPRMQALANEYNDLVRPDKANSLKALKLLHLAAQGAERDAYVNEAISRAKKEGTTIREEKRSAFSESASQNSGTGKTKNPEDMSLEELEALLGRAE